jgi:hypothetical protein
MQGEVLKGHLDLLPLATVADEPAPATSSSSA